MDEYVDLFNEGLKLVTECEDCRPDESFYCYGHNLFNMVLTGIDGLRALDPDSQKEFLIAARMLDMCIDRSVTEELVGNNVNHLATTSTENTSSFTPINKKDVLQTKVQQATDKYEAKTGVRLYTISEATQYEDMGQFRRFVVHHYLETVGGNPDESLMTLDEGVWNHMSMLGYSWSIDILDPDGSFDPKVFTSGGVRQATLSRNGVKVVACHFEGLNNKVFKKLFRQNLLDTVSMVRMELGLSTRPFTKHSVC